MKNILITVLSSGNLDLLEQSYLSCKNQKTNNFKSTICIVINTLNDDYYSQVIEHFKGSDNLSIIRTASNGRPGKGHNSILNLFFQQKDFDYLLPLDGDDFLYPCALQRLELYLQYNPDVLMIPYNDMLINKSPGQTMHFPISDKCYLNYNNFVKDIYNLWKERKISPFKYNINVCNTAGRLVLLSRDALGMKIHYDENLKWYDDFLLFIGIFHYACLNNTKYNIYMLDDCDIYLYNLLNPNSVTEQFKIDNEKKKLEEEHYFRNSVYNKFLNIRHWDLTKINRLKADMISTFTIKDKLEFVNNLVSKLSLPSIEIDKNNINHFIKYCKQEKLNELADLYSKIPDIPPETSEKKDTEENKQTFSLHLNDTNVDITP